MKRERERDRETESRLTFAIENGNVICGQTRLGLDGHQQGGTSARGNTLAGEVLRLDSNGKGALLQGGREGKT